MDDSTRAVLSDWQARVANFQSVHYLKAAKLEKWHYVLGLPAIILNVAATSLIFATISGNDPKLLAIAAIPLLSAIFISVQTFYSHIKRAEQHKAISDQMARIRRQIDLIKLFPPPPERAEAVLAALNEEIAKVSTEAPTINVSDVKTYRDAERDHKFFEMLPCSIPTRFR